LNIKLIFIFIGVTSCAQVDDSVIFELNTNDGITVQIHDNFEVITKSNKLHNSIALDSMKMSFYEDNFNSAFQFYELNEKFTVKKLNNCKYPAIYIKRRIHNGSLENALQTVVLGFKHDRYKVIGYQLDMIYLPIDNEYLILDDLNQIIIKKFVQNKQESGKIIGTYERNLLGCDTVYSSNFKITSSKYQYLENNLYYLSSRSCFKN
jgi:hypothetical protein